MTDRVLILDFGSQVTQLIARRVRECGVYSEIRPFNISAEEIINFSPKAIIFSGGPASVHEDYSPKVSERVFDLNIPIFGICYGEQLLCQQLGGKVEAASHREFGRAVIDIAENCELFSGVWEKGSKQEVWMSHGDRVVELPQGFKVVATTPSAPFAAIADEARSYYAVQFHPEVVHTPDGAKLLQNFVRNVAGCKGDWTMSAFRQSAIARVRAQVGNRKVLCAVSGGVDSSVVAALLHEAIGEQLICIFINNGLLREGEPEQVEKLFKEHFHIPLIHIDASMLFLNRLSGVKDPEQKRKIIGNTFIEVFENEAKNAGGADFLAQGTLYPDVIESVSFVGGPSVTIKSHHNVGGLPEYMKMELVEPLRELFKDEVRVLGRELGMPADMVGRHPFPGPGLAIRIPGELSAEKIELLRKVDTVYIDEIRRSGLYDKIWQAFAVLLPIRSVGVMGDARSYDYVCALRAVTSTDGMTADFYHFDYDFLSRVSNRITNEVKGINRVVYDITSKPPGTIEWE
ncbi:MAG: glutamine-hydrolyzing GMP synthase [Pseudomonadota bacterium]